MVAFLQCGADAAFFLSASKRRKESGVRAAVQKAVCVFSHPRLAHRHPFLGFFFASAATACYSIATSFLARLVACLSSALPVSRRSQRRSGSASFREAIARAGQQPLQGSLPGARSVERK